ncbi:MAG: hypothetical protein IT337_08545 [Thermomicrobiales bacterium]|nr:hypothetical protein [Thermomicrobiales bacterium]
MPRYEIVAHIVCDLECATPEAAAAIVRARLTSSADDTQFRRLGVWRDAETLAAAPLPPEQRRQLHDFFVGLERAAVAAEEAFRDKVAAILAAPAVEVERL